MPNYIITQQDVNIVNQQCKDLYSKVELLNREFKVIDVLEGYLVSDSYSIDATSDVRRTYSMTMIVKDISLLTGEDKKIWMDKFVRSYVGIKESRSDEIVWYCLGVFTMLDSYYAFDETTRELTLGCSDLMSLLNGDRNGNLTGALTHKILRGENVRQVLVDLITEAGFTRFIISDIDNKTIPYDLEFDASATYYQIISEVVGLFSYYEMFFAIDGTFVIQKYPNQDTDSVAISSELFTPFVIKEGLTNTFKNVYNHIQVWGQTIECDRKSKSCTYANNVYTATFDSLVNLEDYAKYEITIPASNSYGAKLNLNNLGTYTITKDDGSPIEASSLPVGSNVFQYRKINGNFYWLGQYQVFAESEETNLASPFHKNKIGKISKVLSGGEYEKIYSNSLAKDRADYELYHACRLQESIDLTMITVPWLDVNWLVEYTSPMTGQTKKYVVKQISGSSNEGTINVSLVAFYDSDPYS